MADDWVPSKVTAKQTKKNAEETPDHPIVAFWKHLIGGGKSNDEKYITDARMRENATKALHNRMIGRSNNPSQEELDSWIGEKNEK